MSLEMNKLRQVAGVGPNTVRALIDAGYSTLAQVAGATPEQLTTVKGVGRATAEAILAFVAGQGDDGDGTVKTYRYDETRKNIPPAGLAAQGKIEERPKVRYSYDPHLPPVLRFDNTGKEDAIPSLLSEAQQRALTSEEVKLLAEALRNHQPWLEWAGKREQRWFEVDPVALHIHERVSAEAIIATARREDVQRSLFADPELEYREQVKFYQHDIDWANRLILGDSLVVMNSLAKREDLAGKVQMIYIDPPYGIKFASNFQPFVRNKEVKDRDSDLTREPEQVRAYRDTWVLGVHSYLNYLRERFTAARELLADTGSIFIQISDENVHLVRSVMDEVFGSENSVAIVTFTKTGGQADSTIASVADYILWYAKNVAIAKTRKLFLTKDFGGEGASKYTSVELPDASSMSYAQALDAEGLPSKDAKLFRLDNITSPRPANEGDLAAFDFNGKIFAPGKGTFKSDQRGMDRLARAGRLRATSGSLAYLRYIDDFPAFQLVNVWTDIGGIQSRSDPKVYVVQTGTKVIERCMLMTTDPGDLVLDPTCGSGTTAYVAEQWGRRWITIDTSRVAVALARQRLLTAKYDYYEKEQPNAPLHPERNNFVYKTVSHITLKSIAQNQALDPIFAEWEPVLAARLDALSAALPQVTAEIRTRLQQKLTAKEKAGGKASITDADRRRWLLPKVKWEEWEVPFDSDPDWPTALQEALTAYRQAWRQKMDAVNTCIADSAQQETLVDQPKLVKGVVRVTGPFTVEGLQPAEETLDLESPIGGEPDVLETFASDGAAAATNADAYLSNMLRLLRQDGVRFPNNQEAHFDRLDPLPNSILHAEGEWTLGEAERRVAVALGPQYGPVTAKQVEDCLWAASRRGVDDLVFAGFTFDGAAQAAIQDDPNPRVRCHMANIRPDVNMGDLLKDTPRSQLFTVFGLPRVGASQNKEGEWVVEMEGVDIYDPATNTVQATRAEKVAAWFLDGDYDGRTFCITQAFFPDRDAWEKLAKALKSVVDPDRFAAFSGTRSLPFAAGQHKRAAVKVIDPRGNEVLRLVSLDKEVRYG